ncbi:MAG: hypothetical protein ACJAZ9_000008 [Neolewinella sp.]|jgi:hypothetical protein
MWKNLALILLFCTCGRAQELLAQQHKDIAFVAEVDKSQMLVNSTVRYQVTLRNAQGEQLKLPNFKDFVILNGPSRSIGTRNFNGVLTSYESSAWLLQPKREGKLTIGPASIRASGRTYRTNSKIIEVLPVDAEATALAPANFLRADISTETAFVGQQIILDLNLYTTTRENSRNLMQEPDFDGFFAQPRRQYDGRPRAVLENGKEYQRRTLGSLALFPTKSGIIKITPYRLIMGTTVYYDTGAGARRRNEQVPLATDTLYIQVNELPQPRPKNFSGAVGNYRIQAQANRVDMTTDDALTFKITITGEGDIQRLEGVPPVNEKDWDIYDPEILQEEFLDSPTGMLGRKVLEYKIVPKRSGVYDLAPGIVYFNTDSAAYVTATDANFKVTVTGGDGAPTYEIDTTKVVEETLSLREVSTLPRGKFHGNAPSSNWPFGALFLLPLFAAGGAIGWQRYQQHLNGRDPAEMARARAARAATARLKAAKVHLDKIEPKAFYDEIEGALLGYLKDKFHLPTSELSRKNISTQLSTAGADANLIQRYDSLLQRCEMALYAGQDKADDLADTYKTARELITETEKVV